eukprot:CAMPEP_0194303750 /NCGR_PEP_ID=MMETSP0171-20130528/1575_1 /TAXON_ID=218684 /ORGANISM="Corethron pennatum, Strain L29A3" /LENGTH=259 /DNA_ID=CAMNT_0039054775 /DNA_START=31 /DNA_END=810 /DNA_ORIENTATION=+
MSLSFDDKVTLGGAKKLTERLHDSKAIRAELIAQNKSKKKLNKFRGSEVAPEENDSVKAIVRDYDFNEGSRSGKIIRAEMVARYKLKNLRTELGGLDLENNRPTSEIMRNKATKMMTAMELGRRLSCEYDLNKDMTFQLFPSDVRSLQLIPSELTPSKLTPSELTPSELTPSELAPSELIPSDKKSQETVPKERLDAENSSPSKRVDRKNTNTTSIHDDDFNNRPSPEMRDKARKMMRAMELGRRLSCEFDLNKNMMFK